MQMPKPTPAHEKLHALAGEWEGRETLHPSPWAPDTRHAVGRFCMRMAVDGMFLLSDYEEERDGAVVFRGHGVYGYDAKREVYTMYWFDSMGHNPNETLGTWDGETLTFANRSDHGHARYVYTLRGPDEMSFRIDSSRDGEQWTCLMEGEFRRRSA
jgi:hypothetical protein